MPLQEAPKRKPASSASLYYRAKLPGQASCPVRGIELRRSGWFRRSLTFGPAGST